MRIIRFIIWSSVLAVRATALLTNYRRTSAITLASWMEYFETSGHGEDIYKSSNPEFNQETETVYGELLPSSLSALLAEPLVQIDSSDIMYDLGSGTGKIPAQFAFETACGRCIGVELGQRRHDIAAAALDSITRGPDKELAKTARAKISFIHGDLLDVHWENDATILFINAFCFPPSLMKKIEKRVKSSKSLKFVFLCGQRFRFDGSMGVGNHYIDYLRQDEVTTDCEGEVESAVDVDSEWKFNLYPLPAPMDFSDETEVQLYVSRKQLRKFNSE